LGIAKALAQEGVDMAIASRNPDPAAIEELRALGARVVAIPTDVSREDQVKAMIDAGIASFGRIDLYVNNAAWT
jgi:citronellol/citronellal dehydrogenase